MAAVKLAIRIDHADWATVLPEVRSVVRRAARAALRRLPLPPGRPAELSLVLSSDANLRMLNRRYRGRDKATNVLSFPSGEAMAAADETPLLLGDVVLALQTIEAEAEAQGKGLHEHLSHLVVHGVLHLAGYDHETACEAEVMERLEIDILRRLGIANPYLAVSKPGRRA